MLRDNHIQLMDAEGRYVTPLLYPAYPGDILPLDEIFSNTGSNCSKPGTFSANDLLTSSPMPESISQSSLSSDDFWTEMNSSLALQDINPNLPVAYKVPVKRDHVEEEVTEDVLDEVAEVVITETDTMSLLEIFPTSISEDADDSNAVKERNIQYAELSRNKIDNYKYIDQYMQTFSGMPKEKSIQKIMSTVVDKGTNATNWDRYESFCEQKAHKADDQDVTVSTRRGQEKREESVWGDTGSPTSSLLETEKCEGTLEAQPDLQELLLSESFKSSLLVMERCVAMNIFRPKLSAFKNLLKLDDPECSVKPGLEGQHEEDEEHLTPTMERLWVFVCDLTKGYDATSMAWSKIHPDVLAVGYSDCDSRSPTPGLICCWSLKNPTRPERVYSCHSGVTCLDFSANNTSQLAVGMQDGSVSIYDVQTERASSQYECSRKQLHPMKQVTWTKQQLKLSGEDREEVLVSVSTAGTITKWFLGRSGLDCIDLMKLKIFDKKKKLAGGMKMKDNFLVPVTPALCFDFHPTEFGIYLVGTYGGVIHECCFSNSKNFLNTYKHHFGSVNDVKWSPFSPDVFLSCSSDWTMQLWERGGTAPVMSFKSAMREVYGVQWFSNWPAMFAATYEQQVEVWDLNQNLMFPTVTHNAAPGVKLTCLLLPKDSDSVLVGDSEGQVTVYKLNLRAGPVKKVESLDGIVSSHKE